MDKPHDKRNKIKRVALVALQVLTCGLALFGLFGAISCVRSCSTTPPTTSGASRGVYDAHRRNRFTDDQNAFLAEGSQVLEDIFLDVPNPNPSNLCQMYHEKWGYTRVTPTLKAGTYLFKADWFADGEPSGYRCLAPLSKVEKALGQVSALHASTYIEDSGIYDRNVSDSTDYYTITEEMALEGYVMACTWHANIPDWGMAMVLVDGLRAPAQDIYDLSNFNGSSLVNGIKVTNLPLIDTSNLSQYTEIVLQGMVFRSNAMLFDRLRVKFMPVNAGFGVVQRDGGLVDLGETSSHFVYVMGIEYHTFGDSGSWLPVCGARWYYGNSSVYLDWGLEWRADAFKRVEVLDYAYLKNSATLNGRSNQYWFSTFVSSDDVSSGGTLYVDGNNPIDLLSKGFSAWGDILAINILPNISIGLLIFIPLIVTIILVIVRLLQK